MAFGMLAKGPVAPFLGALVIISFMRWRFAELRPVLKSLWLPGIFIFCAIALAVVLRGATAQSEFFREFIVEHNLGRFSENLYHHSEPFWYYLPVTALALAPWTVFVIAGFGSGVRSWWAQPKPAMPPARIVPEINWAFLRAAG